jgi:myosin heavy subunit
MSMDVVAHLQVTLCALHQQQQQQQQLMRDVQGTKHKLVKMFFPPPEAGDEKRRPTTTAFKIKSQAQKLVKTLLECSPHYVRTVKSNETKSKKTFDRERVMHQVQPRVF